MAAPRRFAVWAVPLALVLGAAAPRFWHLDRVPLGLHGDEAVTGMDARRVLRDGWIGPYLYPSALGQPAGPAYVAAAVLGALGESTATLRLSMALFGVGTVLFTYLAARAMFSRAVAVLAAILLAALPWHLHLSRIAFMVNAWPCLQMATLWLLFRARQGAPGSALHAIPVGVAAGLTLYTYNAAPLSLPLFAVPFLYDLFHPPVSRRRTVAAAAVAAATALVVALPLLDYIRTHEEYFWHQEEVGVTHTAAWRDGDWPDRAALLAARAAEWGRGLAIGGRPDDGDGLGGVGYPLLDPLSGVAALLGLGLAVRRWREPACGVLIGAVLLLPLGALLTIEDGLYRRTLGLAPFVAMLAALPLARLWHEAKRRGGAPRQAAAAALGALLALSAARTALAYFGPLQASEQMRYVFPYQVDAAARFLAAQPRGAAVYWYSERWPATYETLRWWAPDVAVGERSPEHGAASAGDGGPVLAADSDRGTLFVLLGRYIDLAPDLARRHGGAVHEERRDGEVLFRAVTVEPPAP